MTEFVFLVEEAPECGYTARGVGAPVFTEADTLEELREAVRDAVRLPRDLSGDELAACLGRLFT